MLKKEFPPTEKWFINFHIRLDLGFQGFLDLYESKSLTIPHKKKRTAKGVSNELSKEQIQFNKTAGKDRIYVEHSIGGMKRYKILVHRCALKSKPIRDCIVGVCAALWNYFISV